MTRLILLSVLFISSLAKANEVSTSRYTITDTEASAVQRFPLIDVRTTNLPSNIVTNRQAVDYILMSTGYSQANDSVRSPQDRTLMRKPIALSNREFVNLTVLEMLSIVAGLGYVPIVDPINRLVAFEAIYDFQQ